MDKLFLQVNNSFGIEKIGSHGDYRGVLLACQHENRL